MNPRLQKERQSRSAAADLLFVLPRSGRGVVNPDSVSCFRVAGVTAASRGLFPFRARKGNEKGPPFRCGGRRLGLRPQTPRCGHLKTAYSGPGGPEQGMDFNGVAKRPQVKRKRATRLGATLPDAFRKQPLLGNGIKSIPCSPVPRPVRRPSSGGRTPRVQGRSPGRRPPPRNGGGLPRRGKQRAALFPKLVAAFSGNLEVAT